MKSIIFLLLTAFATALTTESSPITNLQDEKNVVEVRKANSNFTGQTLTIFNSADYIDEELITAFEKQTGAHVNYYTFDTNETMYNQFTLQPEGTYDLINASDYMIQKMIREGRVEKINIAKEVQVYDEYASNTVRGKLKSMMADTDGDGIKDTSLDEYSVGYMWGTLGIIYDPYCSNTIREDVKSWDVFWNQNYKNLISIKNSMRDTFAIGQIHAYSGSSFTDEEDILHPAREKFLAALENAKTEEEKELAREEYNKVIQYVFDTILLDENYNSIIETVKTELIELKKNIFGFEVDSGKNDIVTGKIKMNLAWSGDAVYSIETAMEEQGKVLEYSVPEDGSNIWYDGWMLPNGANRELACAFMNFLSEPANAAKNMEYIGYTPFIACDEVFDMVSDWYGVADFYEGREYYAENIDEEIEASIVHYDDSFYQCIQDSIGNLPTDEAYFEKVAAEELGLGESYDLNHIFKGKLAEGRNAIIYPYEDSANHLETQYPDIDTIARCGVMSDFEKANDAVVIMWGQIRAYTNMLPYYIILGSAGGIVLTFFIIRMIKKQISSRNKRYLANYQM